MKAALPVLTQAHVSGDKFSTSGCVIVQTAACPHLLKIDVALWRSDMPIVQEYQTPLDFGIYFPIG